MGVQFCPPALEESWAPASVPPLPPPAIPTLPPLPPAPLLPLPPVPELPPQPSAKLATKPTHTRMAQCYCQLSSRQRGGREQAASTRKTIELPKPTESKGTRARRRGRRLPVTLIGALQRRGASGLPASRARADTPSRSARPLGACLIPSRTPARIAPGTRCRVRAAGGALGPRPCSASKRVIWARALATSAQRIGPVQRGQASTSAESRLSYSDLCLQTRPVHDGHGCSQVAITLLAPLVA